ncbi:carbonic anhydrase [Marinivivus vitaminiproducens]|uniref:carbonic anhydrase n=1 Tax=Marinivivus vitaminiproducens TaxID=3035935 RepID=UPI0027A397DD|nr:carbonic anhydrase [Geminicoccaceae bacterium SCSIO 64248]
MDELIQGARRFRDEVFPRQRGLFNQLAVEGQAPKTLVISCADSRVVPEMITQSAPGQIFVCRNVGNIVPPTGQGVGGVSSVIEYAVAALGVTDIVVCGHSGCGAMKALSQPDSLEGMPNVAAWLRHADAARQVVAEAYPAGMDGDAHVRSLALENVAAQLGHLRTHPAVAARIASGAVRLHGWFFDIASGEVLALDGELGRFVKLADAERLPVALSPARRAVAAEAQPLAAE